MKVAVSSEGKTLDSKVDQRFGRAACLLVVDTGTMEFQAVENADAAAAGGAGINAAKAVVDAGVQAVLTGNCGPNAERTLRAAGIKLFTGIAGTVAEAIDRYKRGTLTETSGPNVQAHFGAGI